MFVVLEDQFCLAVEYRWAATRIEPAAARQGLWALVDFVEHTVAIGITVICLSDHIRRQNGPKCTSCHQSCQPVHESPSVIPAINREFGAQWSVVGTICLGNYLYGVGAEPARQEVIQMQTKVR